MRASNIHLSIGDDGCRLQADVTSTLLREPFPLWYRFPLEFTPVIDLDSGNPWLIALLIPAMVAGEPLEIPFPVSERLVNSLVKIQYILRTWDRTLSSVKIIAPSRRVRGWSGSNMGLFFSCGVDSFYSLLRHMIEHPMNEGRITHLVVVQGVDVKVNDRRLDLYDHIWNNAKIVAARVDRQAVGIATNIKNLTSQLGIPWGLLAQGAALASVGLFLENVFGKFLLASGGTTYDHVPASGIHPFLDPLWSTEGCAFVHDGLEATRLDKIKFIAQSQLALEFLRPCWAREHPGYSCGRCSKCLRTMIGLHIVDALRRCRTLPDTIDSDALRHMPCLTFSEVYYQWPNFIDHLGSSESDEELRQAAVEGLAASRHYFDLISEAKKIIGKHIPVADRFILVDQDTIREHLGAGRRVIPFLERDGRYNGRPADDDTAVGEVERQRAAGARFMVFWQTEFWWLDHYGGLSHHLRTRYRLVVEEESLMVFCLADAA